MISNNIVIIGISIEWLYGNYELYCDYIVIWCFLLVIIVINSDHNHL